MTVPQGNSETRKTSRQILVSVLQAALLCFVVFIAFGQSLANKFIWDDDQYIEFNPALKNLTGLGQLWIPPIFARSAYTGQLQYYPITLTTFWIEYQLWDGQPLGYHLDNLLLHAGTAILLWRILRRLQVPAAFFAAMIFACHPVLAESVAWATERKNVLSAFFYMASLWCYLPWIDRPAVPAQPRIYVRGYILSLSFFIAALLSKSVTASLPAAILLLIYWKRGRITRADIKPLLPFFALGITMGLVTRYVEMHVVGAIGPDFNWSFLDRLAIAGRVVWFYLGKLLWPANLAFIYPRWNIDAAHQPWQLLFLLGVIMAVGGLWMLRNRIGRGPLVAALFFAGTLFPAMGFSNVYPMKFSFVADHFQYLAAIGPIVLFAASVNWIFSRRTDRESPFPVTDRTDSRAAIILSVVCFPLCAISLLHTQVYRELPTLWKDTLSKSPHAWVAMNNLAVWEIQQSRSIVDLSEPELWLEKSLQEKPDNTVALLNLGIIDERHKNFAAAMKWYLQDLKAIPVSDEPVIQRMKYDPNFHLGWCYRNLAANPEASNKEVGQYVQSAEHYFAEAEKADPARGEAPYELGFLLLYDNHIEEGIAQLQKAVDIDPANLEYRQRLAQAELQAHQ